MGFSLSATVKHATSMNEIFILLINLLVSLYINSDFYVKYVIYKHKI